MDILIFWNIYSKLKLGQGKKAEWFMKEALKRARDFIKDGSIVNISQYCFTN